MAFLDKINKFAKNIEEKTGDAIEISKYSATIASSEHSYNSSIKQIGEFYYQFFINGGQVEADILPVLQSAKENQDAIAAAKAEIEKINAENKAAREAAKAERHAAREAAKAEDEVAEENMENPAPETAESAEEITEEITNSTAANSCPGCGAQVDAGAKFCGECGYKMED